MRAYRSVSKPITILLALLMAVTAFAFIASDSTDAADVVLDGKNIEAKDFKKDVAGTLIIPVTCNLSDGTHVYVTVKEGSNTVYSESVTQGHDLVNGVNKVKVSFKLSEGSHNVTVSVSDAGSQDITINVAGNVWANVGTYVALVIIAIIVVIIAVVYMRANPRNKPTTTFTQLEEEKAAKAAEPEAPKTEKKGTDKVKYVSSRRK